MPGLHYATPAFFIGNNPPLQGFPFLKNYICCFQPRTANRELHTHPI